VAIVAFVLGLPSGWCSQHEVGVTFHDNDYQFSDAERDAIQTVADAAAVDVRRSLPTLPRKLVMQVHAGRQVVAETGETGYSVQPNIVYWTVDPSHSGGVMAIARTQLRTSLFEFLHRLVRRQAVATRTLMDDVVTDGMAIAFARDFGGAASPWGVYPDSILSSVNELMALPLSAQREYLQSSSRRWLRFHVGTYLVDQAVRSSGLSPASLVSRSTADVLRMAGR
jgi:hypothetical protein